MPLPQIDWLDPTDEQVIALLDWYDLQVTDKSVDVFERVGYASGALRTVKKLLEDRLDWRKQRRQEVRELGRAHRASKARDAAWEAGVNREGPL